eukprot:188944-Chlamydomonas_euryale.AAC.5
MIRRRGASRPTAYTGRVSRVSTSLVDAAAMPGSAANAWRAGAPSWKACSTARLHSPHGWWLPHKLCERHPDRPR